MVRLAYVTGVAYPAFADGGEFGLGNLDGVVVARDRPIGDDVTVVAVPVGEYRSHPGSLQVLVRLRHCQEGC